MATIAVDSKSHQAVREQGTEAELYGRSPRAGEWRDVRLTGLRDGLHDADHTLEIVDIEADDLSAVGVLIIAGRCNAVMFSDSELERIKRYSENGGAIMLMANHPPGFVSPQNQVSDALDLPITFEMAEGHSGRYNMLRHEITNDCEDIQIRRFCRISTESNASVIIEHADPSIGPLAIAIEANASRGRIVVIGSAGHIASVDDSKSDLFGTASNSKVTINSIEWLLGT